ncbi:unnamed protein product [Camellia sinensis]
MPRQNRVVEGLIPGSCKIRKRGCSSSSSSVLQNYQFKRRTTAAALDSHKYAPSQSGGGRSRPVSGRKLAATLWEMNEVPSPRVGDNLEEKKAIKREMRVRERMEVPRSVHSGSLPPHLSDPSHSPVSEWERLGDIIVLPMTSFKDPAWDSVGAELWPIVAKSLGAQRLARQIMAELLQLELGTVLWRFLWEIMAGLTIGKMEFSIPLIQPSACSPGLLEYLWEVALTPSKSVLVTIDRHEWYAPPQIYTRNDSTGLWKIKPALPPESPFLSLGMNKAEKAPAKHTAPLDAGEAHDINQESTDGSPSIETSSEYVAVGLHSHDDSDVGTKKWQVEEDSSADSIVIANCSLHEPREEKLEDSTNSENAFLEDCQGVSVTAANASVAERVIEPTLVMFEVHVPPSCMVDGVRSQHFLGTGVIIYHSHNMGLVAVDKNTVAISVSDVMLSFAAFPIEIPGEVIFLHPVHNYALVAYDPSALGADGASAVRAAELLPAIIHVVTEPMLRRGDTVCLVGLSRSLQTTSRKSVVTNPYAALNIGSADRPHYRATNMEAIELDTDFGSTFSGVLTDEHGRVQALWGSFSTQLKYRSSSSEDHQFARGIPIYTISQVLDKIISGANGPKLLINGVRRPMPLVRILEVELYPTLLSKARSFGLSDKWIQAKSPPQDALLKLETEQTFTELSQQSSIGTLLNVRKASHKQIMENAEITSIKQILGLQHGKQYDNVKTLRYGHLMIMTDQGVNADSVSQLKSAVWKERLEGKHERASKFMTLGLPLVQQQVPYITTALMDAKLGTKGRKDLFDWLSRQLSGLKLRI